MGTKTFYAEISSDVLCLCRNYDVLISSFVSLAVPRGVVVVLEITVSVLLSLSIYL